MEIAWFTGEREQLRDLFALAEDSPQQLEAALRQGRVLVATDDGEVVAYLQLAESDSDEQAEVTSLAVAADRQGAGIGRALVERAIAECRAEGVRTLLVATGSADVGNLRFYQRLGFRMLRIERDAFTAADGYPDGLTFNGIPLRDRVWFDLTL